MKNIHRFKLLSTILVLAYLLTACSGVSQQSKAPSGSGKPQSMEVAFSGTVESVSPNEITISGQIVSIDAKTILDPNIKVGDIVKVEAQVADTGAVLALKVESFKADDVAPTASSNETSTPEAPSPSATDTPAVTNTPDPSITQTANGMEKEIVGIVTDITANSVTVDGVVYQFANSTEFKDAIFAGDTVKIHVIVNADGTLMVREIEKSAGTTIGDDNSNNNGSSSDDSNNDENDDNGGSSNGGSDSGG